MIQLKLTKIGNSVGVVLPKELLAQLKVGLGDTLFCSEVPDGVKMTAYDESVAEDLNLAEEILRSRRNVLRALANCPSRAGYQFRLPSRSTVPNWPSMGVPMGCGTWVS